jgi:hypothetical protein
LSYKQGCSAPSLCAFIWQKWGLERDVIGFKPEVLFNGSHHGFPVQDDFTQAYHSLYSLAIKEIAFLNYQE